MITLERICGCDSARGAHSDAEFLTKVMKSFSCPAIYFKIHTCVLFVQQIDGESRKLTEDDSTLDELPNFQSCTYKPGCKTGTKHKKRNLHVPGLTH